ncbi:imidazole glycerol phosphate synthase subunit HisH [Candidatus Margulisiibacteriota bacterium]
MVIIVDYGVGNLRSVQKAIEFLGHSAKISSQPDEIKQAQTIVVPGQGAFSQAMANLKKKDLLSIIENHINNKKPFLGICVGFQILFEKSFEHGENPGLGVFQGSVKRFNLKEYKIPHMGWNSINKKADPGEFFAGLGPSCYTYFVHSYYVETDQTEIISTTTDYGIEFVSAIQAENLLATQFHPEKSGKVGMTILKNFFERINNDK